MHIKAWRAGGARGAATAGSEAYQNVAVGNLAAPSFSYLGSSNWIMHPHPFLFHSINLQEPRHRRIQAHAYAYGTLPNYSIPGTFRFLLLPIFCITIRP